MHTRTHTHRCTHILSFGVGASNLPLILALIFDVSSMRVPCHLNIAKPAAGHRLLTTQRLHGAHQWFRELYIPISCQDPGAMDSIQKESHSITIGVHCGFVCFLPVLMHKVNTVVPMCTGVRACVCVCVRGWLGWMTVHLCAFMFMCLCVFLMAPHQNNIIYIKNNASYMRSALDRLCAEMPTACEWWSASCPTQLQLKTNKNTENMQMYSSRWKKLQ